MLDNVINKDDGVISFGNINKKRIITNISGGVDDHDAVNVLQLKKTNESVNKKANEIKVEITNDSNLYTDKIAKKTQDAAVKESKLYTDNKAKNTKNAAIKESVNYTNKKIKQLEYNQMNIIESANLYTDYRFNEVNKKINSLDKKIDRGLASSAALTMLFQPYGIGNINITAGIGGYGSETSIAIGTGYRFDKNKAIRTGISSSTSNTSNLTYGAAINLEW